MRLIDADELKLLIHSKSTRPDDTWDTMGVLNAINQIPTIERQNIAVIPPELIKELAETVVGIIKDIDWKTAIEKYSEQSKGRWIFNGDCSYRCSNCNAWDYYDYQEETCPNYCPNCGAYMKGADNATT